MRRLKNFECLECDEVKEELVNDGVNTVKCKECGSECKKMVSSARYLGNTTGKYPKIK